MDCTMMSAFVPSLAVTPSRFSAAAPVAATSINGKRARVPSGPVIRKRVLKGLPVSCQETPTPTPPSTPAPAEPEAAAAEPAETTPTSASASTPASESASSTSASAAGAEPEEARKVPFEIRGFSLANLFLAAGAAITVLSFSSYFNSAGTASATSLGFVYGVPILLVGCALKYAELQPVPVESLTGAAEARAASGTDTQKQIYKDITRHRYGDEAHLSSAMSSLGLIPRGEACPVLERAVERVSATKTYELELVFYSVATPYKTWVERKDRYDRFFGPGVSVEVKKVDAANRLVGLVITSQLQQE